MGSLSWSWQGVEIGTCRQKLFLPTKA